LQVLVKLDCGGCVDALERQERVRVLLAEKVERAAEAM
jgi:hypothetical protein